MKLVLLFDQCTATFDEIWNMPCMLRQHDGQPITPQHARSLALKPAWALPERAATWLVRVVMMLSPFSGDTWHVLGALPVAMLVSTGEAHIIQWMCCCKLASGCMLMLHCTQAQSVGLHIGK